MKENTREKSTTKHPNAKLTKPSQVTHHILTAHAELNRSSLNVLIIKNTHFLQFSTCSGSSIGIQKPHMFAIKRCIFIMHLHLTLNTIRMSLTYKGGVPSSKHLIRRDGVMLKF